MNEEGKGNPVSGPLINTLYYYVSTFIVPIIVAVVFSHLIQKFTHSALWLPSEWRITIEVFVGLGTAFIALIMTRVSEYFNHQKNTYWILIFSSTCFGLAIILFWLVYSAREECIWNLNQDISWWRMQYGEPTNSSITGLLPSERIKIPDYLNPDRNTIFLPDEFDKEMQDYLRSLGAGNIHLGIRKALDREPMRLIDWVGSAGKPFRTNTVHRLLFLHFGCIFFFAAAWAGYSDKEMFASKYITKQILNTFRML